MRAVVDVLDDGGLAQPGFPETTREALVLAAGCLTVDQQPKPVLAAEFAGVGRVLQLDEGIGHGGEAERAQALDGRMDQHRNSSQW
jgi:hypothetical protein